MRYILPAIVLVILIPIVIGQEFPSYYDIKNADISIAINSDVQVKGRSDGYLQADLRYLPRDDFMQRTISLGHFAQPDADIKQEDPSIVYTWDEVKGDYRYGLNAQVHTENSFAKVTEKISFPVQSLDKELLAYTRAGKFIDITPDIEKQAREIIQGEKELYRAVYLLADWTRENIDYSLDTLTAEAVYSSSWVLQNKRGVCDELTNLFISMLRSLGIPARFVSGVVYTNQDGNFGNHGWAEVYFPGTGWVPFDVTYGQYGWIDITHVKLKDDVDSGTPGVLYSWTTDEEVKVEIGKISIDAKFENIGNKIESPLKIEVQPLKTKVGFGSFVPVEVKVRNPTNYYIATTLAMTKAPGIIGDNVKGIVVEPGGESAVYWILEIPSNLDNNYIYTAQLEVKDGFSGSGTGSIVYGAEDEVYQLSDAESYVAQQAGRTGKEEFGDLNVGCNPQRERYYAGEEVRIQCMIETRSSFNGKVCLLDNCENLRIASPGSASVLFALNDISSGRFTVVAEDEKHIMYSPVSVKITAIPSLKISDYQPRTAKYREEIPVELVLESNVAVKNVHVKINRRELVIDELEGKDRIRFTVNSKKLIYGLDVRITYEDEEGKTYDSEEKLAFDVTDLSWWARFKMRIYRLFS